MPYYIWDRKKDPDLENYPHAPEVGFWRDGVLGLWILTARVREFGGLEGFGEQERDDC